MAWVKIHKKSGNIVPDGNSIEYPVQNPSFDNKAYKESDINAIALALDETGLTVADMADAISALSGGLHATIVSFSFETYTVVT